MFEASYDTISNLVAIMAGFAALISAVFAVFIFHILLTPKSYDLKSRAKKAAKKVAFYKPVTRSMVKLTA